MAHSYKDTFQSGRGFCPATGEKCNWSYKGNFHHPSFVISYGKGSLLYDWIHVGEAETGGQMFSRRKDSSASQQDQITLETWAEPNKPIPPEEIASPRILHLIYSLLLKFCPLSSSHEASLIGRGFPIIRLKKLLPAGSLPAFKLRPQIAQKVYEEAEISREELLKVPGFFINKNGHLSLVGASGILLPSYDTKD